MQGLPRQPLPSTAQMSSSRCSTTKELRRVLAAEPETRDWSLRMDTSPTQSYTNVCWVPLGTWKPNHWQHGYYRSSYRLRLPEGEGPLEQQRDNHPFGTLVNLRRSPRSREFLPHSTVPESLLLEKATYRKFLKVLVHLALSHEFPLHKG